MNVGVALVLRRLVVTSGREAVKNDERGRAE